VRGDVHTNTIEGYFSILKRGINGVYHHVSQQQTPNKSLDCGTSISPGEWLAKDFYDGSFGSVVEFVKNVEPPEAVKFNSSIRFFSRFKNDHLPPDYSADTIPAITMVAEVLLSIPILSEADVDKLILKARTH
jgi:hypothetical protein